MKTNIIVWVFVIGLMAFGSYVVYSCPDVTDKNSNIRLSESASDNTVVVIRDFMMTPDVVTIPAGATVTWINNDSVSHTIASNPHPDHSILPELDSIVINPGESFSFRFTTMGEWGYHSHLHPIVTGKVIVVE